MGRSSSSGKQVIASGDFWSNYQLLGFPNLRVNRYFMANIIPAISSFGPCNYLPPPWSVGGLEYALAESILGILGLAGGSYRDEHLLSYPQEATRQGLYPRPRPLLRDLGLLEMHRLPRRLCLLLHRLLQLLCLSKLAQLSTLGTCSPSPHRLSQPPQCLVDLGPGAENLLVQE